MKHILPIALMVALVTFATQTNATIRRVGYFGTATAIDYVDLQTAHDAAAAGDTIYLYPGNWSASWSKRLTLLGYGYFLTGTQSNPGLQNITGALSVNITLNTGSDKSTFQSLDGLNVTIANSMVANNIIINRCNLNYLNLNDQVNTGWQITQSFIRYVRSSWYGGSFTKFAINNSVIYYLYFGGQTTSGVFNNDFFDGFAGSSQDLNNGSVVFTSCIFNYGLTNIAAAVFRYCVGTMGGTGANGGQYYTTTPLPTGNGNKLVDISTVYVGYPGGTVNYSFDNGYVLSANSAAKGAGQGGTDCGIYGGVNPYVLSGLPPVPSFITLGAPSNVTSTNPYTITFSIQSH